MRKIDITRGSEVAMRIELHDAELNVVVHEEIWPEIKPVQFDTERDTYVECTPEQRAEIIRVAEDYGRRVFRGTHTDGNTWPNICWHKFEQMICGAIDISESKKDNWLPFPEFLARLKGEWQEPIEVSEAHSSIVIDDLQNRVSGEALEMANNRDTGGFAEYVKAVVDPPPKKQPVEPEVRKDIHGVRVQVGDKVRGFGHLTFQDGWKVDLSPTVDVTIQDGVMHFGMLSHSSFDRFEIVKRVDTQPVETRIPFSPERMKDAIRYETRDGREVKCVVLNDVESEFPVTGYIGRQFCAWTELGNYMRSIHDTITDLFMVIKGGEE